MQETQEIQPTSRPGNSGPMADYWYSALTHEYPEHAQYVVVNWCFGNTCNYECSYCPASLHDGSDPWVDIDRALAFVDKVLAHYGPEKKYFFEITGGEITLYKDFIKFAEYVQSKGCKLGIISNGSRSMQFWERVRPLLNQICLSFHPESANPAHFLDVVKYLSETVRTHVNIMMDPDSFDFCYEIAARAKDVPNISMALQPLIVDFGSELYNYTETQKMVIDRQHQLLDRFIKHTKTFEYYRGAMAMTDGNGRREVITPQSLVATGMNSWQGWKCNIGLEQFVVDHDGSIYRGWCRVGGKIGKLSDENLALPEEPITCNKKFCHCNLDIMVTKTKPNE